MTLKNNSLSSWNITKGIVFRFLFSYLVLCIWPFPLYFIPFSWYVLQPVQGVFQQMTHAVGPLLLGKYYVNADAVTGSDTSYKYAQTFVFLMIATASTLVWSIADRKRWTYEK